MALELEYQVLGDQVGNTSIGVACGEGCAGYLNITSGLQNKLNQGWQLSQLKLSCFADQGADMSKISSPLVLTTAGPLQIQLRSISLVSNQGDASCSL